MGFTDSASKISVRTMAFQALLKHDLDSLLGSWLVRIWFILSGLLTLLILAPGWASLQTAPFIGTILFPFLVFPWFFVVMILGVSPVTGTRAEVLADGILCRPVTRIEYLLAAWFARLAVVLGVYLAVAGPAILLVKFANRPAYPDAVTTYGLFAAVWVVGLVLTFQVTLGFLLGTLVRSTMLSLVVLVLAWVPINLVLTTFSLEEFSPISLNQAIPTLLRTEWSPTEDATATTDRQQLEQLGDSGAQFLAILSGTTAPPPRPQEREFFDQTRYEDFSLTRVVLGYGIPTVLSMALAAMFFCTRDF